MSEESDLNEQLSLLIVRCANSNKSSLTKLYELTAPKLYAIQVRILGRSPMTERALHDTYQRVWLKAHQFDAKNGHAMAWMTSIARNHALNLRRAKTDKTASNPNHFDTLKLSDEFEGMDLLEASSLTDPMLAAFMRFDEKTRESIAWVYLDGLSWKELSEIYNEPVEKVRDAIHNSMLTLRGTLHAPIR